MVTLSFTIFSGQKNYNRAHMLFQVLCGFEPIFYTTHPNEESIFSINKRERRNTKMEISLDNMQVSFMTAGIKTASDSVSLTAAETEIKSRSEAMDKFQEEYRQLKAFVKDYRDTLNNDLAKIDLIINAINENDRKQGDYIKNGIGLSDTAVIP